MYWGEDIGREYVTDYFVVSYAPSLRILRHCLNKKTRETNKVLIAHADSENGGSLLFSRREAISLARLYGVSPTLGITRRDLIQEAKHANLIHYTGHADLEGLDVRSEGDSKRGKFSAPDLIMDLAMPDARLAIMSACETGKALLGLTDEYLTPADAFLCKGAKTVVSSLWAVPEVTTCMLMWKMHESLLKGTGTAKSLQEAQRWLRQSNLDQRVSLLKEFGFRSENPKAVTSSGNTGFTREPFRVEQLLPEDVSHPYYWAGFICTGAP
jgi:CHAT domain-containing protein